VKRHRVAAERVFLLAPALALLAVTVALPLGRVAALAFTRTELSGRILLRWNAFGAFARLWQDSRWWSALSNTLVFTISSVALELVLGVTFALFLDREFRGRGAVRAIVLVPWALPTAVMALAWAWIFNDSFGITNDLLQRAGLIASPVAWLGDPPTAMAAMILADVWKTTPFVAVIVLAGLQGIPGDVLEAARVDGLGAAARLRRVVLPLALPAMAVAAAFRALQAYGTFDLAYAMTGGGPGGATETISLYAFRCDFRYLDFGYGSAIAVQGALLALAVAAAAATVARRVREGP
jgi:multiple sugar transport system permease protein